MPVNQIRELLRNSVYLDRNESTIQSFHELVSHVTEWEDLASQAERAGIATLLYLNLKNQEISIPAETDLMFRSLSARHTRSNRDRNNALIEILEAFDKSGIQSILLKGMALIHVLYDDNSLRPMGDIDILVSFEQAAQAQQLLRDIGYAAGERKKGYMYDHHHLPIATKLVNGMTIQVEIHHDALSGDVGESMSFDTVFESSLPLQIDGFNTSTMGHIDMLRHLCHHAFEPCETVKLGQIADIYGYASRYCGDIDWKHIRDHQPFLHNTLRCLHFLSPLPDSLQGEVTPPRCKVPDRVGFGFPTLSSISASKSGLFQKLTSIVNCSPWWMHVHYVVPPENTLLWVRYFRHPMRVVYWILRRKIAQYKSNHRM